MFNPFVVRKYAALLLPSLLSVVLYTVAMTYYGLFYAVIFFLVSLLLGALLGMALLNNPFRLILEGKGIMAINIDSTGIITPFIVGVQSPYIRGKVGNKEIEDVFDRSTIMQFAAPKKNTANLNYISVLKPMPNADEEKVKEAMEAAQYNPCNIKDEDLHLFEKHKGVRIELDEEGYNNARMALYHWPVILHNAQVGSIITKEFLSEKEKHLQADHIGLYLNIKLKELTSVVRDFGRHIVDLTRPKTSLMGSWWVWVIVIVLMVLLVALFFPSVLTTIGKTASSGTAAFGAAKGNAITPIG